MTTKLNKTQQALIERARKYGGKASVEAGSGRGAKGGRISYGRRELEALWALRDAGLIEVTHRDTDNDTNRGYTVRRSSFLYALKVGV